MNPLCQGAKIGDSLKLVIRDLDVKVVFHLGKEIERLQAVDSEFLEEIVIRSQIAGRNLEMVRGKLQELFKGLI
jgi:hypothetical protein